VAAEVAMAAEAYGYLSAGIGAGIVTVGAGLGIGKIAAMAVDGTARQPEAANDIRSSMIITAAFIEGVALFGQVVCFLLATK
jgi:F-type H+-transporting ATPase subunit c